MIFFYKGYIKIYNVKNNKNIKINKINKNIKIFYIKNSFF